MARTRRASDPSQRLIGNPSGWVPFKEANVVHYLRRRVSPIRAQAIGRARPSSASRLSTNEFGMHDDPVAVEKPDGTFRIAVLGSSIDMGWGVKHQDTYINQLEEWLNFALGSAMGSRRRGGSRCSTSAWRPIAPCSASRRSAAR